MVTLLKSISLPRIIKASRAVKMSTTSSGSKKIPPIYFRAKLATSDVLYGFNIHSEDQLWRNIKEYGSIVDTAEGGNLVIESLVDLKQALQVINNFLFSFSMCGLPLASGSKSRRSRVIN